MRSANSSNKVLRETKQRYEVMVGEAKRRDKVTMTEGAKIRDWGGGRFIGLFEKAGVPGPGGAVNGPNNAVTAAQL